MDELQVTQIVGVVVMAVGAMVAIRGVTASDEKIISNAWKSRWVEERFGRRGLRIYYFLVGALFVWLGYKLSTLRFP